MHLQSLEMIGFKSFVLRTTLHLHRGVTAIVGPNGCGKSNILDAIRWVLGEQSAKSLRGGEMADVIFSGTDSRQALGMAEVSLTFSECEKELGVEWNEVCISRRVYRDGKGEYFLNKAPCRLRDIQQLFMDTGVGRSAYSIMEQGKIDLILSSRPEDRRAIFEEAAGITKYKSQKKEALRKLEYTDANLLRAQDIIKEVRRQIGSLQRQAAKARRYQALMKDLRIFDIHLSHRNYRELSSDLEEIRRELARGEEARAICESQISEQEAELYRFRARIEDLDEEVARVREQVQTLSSRVFSAESRVASNLERCEEARAAIERYRMDIVAADEKMRVQQDQISQTDHLLEQMIAELGAREAALEERVQKVAVARGERDAAERQIQELSASIAKLEARSSSSREEISALAARREAAETRLALLWAESEAASATEAQLEGRVLDIERRAQLAERNAESSRAEQSEAQAAFAVAQERRQSSEVALNAISREAAGVESLLGILRQLQEQGEGLEEGSQAVLHGLDDPDLFKAAICGELADHIRVEPRFIPAIEAALGPSLRAIIFKDSGVAELALQELSRRKLGKATIALREWMAANRADSKRDQNRDAVLPNGAIAWASECITGEPEAMALAARLLDGMVVTETLEMAFQIKAANPAVGIATLAGEFVSREGIVSGGQTGENGGQSALARRAQIAKLEEDLATVALKVESHAAARAEALRTLEVSQDRLLAAREGFQSAQVESASIQNEHHLAQRELADFKDRRSACLQEIAQLQESLESSLAQLQKLELLVAEIARSLEQSRIARLEAEDALQAKRERENTAIDDLNEIRVSVATERQQQENLSRQRAPMSLRLAELAEMLAARRSDIAGYQARIETLESQSSTLRESIAAWRAESAALESEIDDLLSARAEVSESAEALEIASRSARQQLVQFQEQKGRQEVRMAQVEMRMENLRNHVSQRYQSDLETFQSDTYALLCSFRDRNKKAPSHDAQAGEGSGEEVSPEPHSRIAPEDTSETQGSGDQAETINWDRIEQLAADLTERIEAMGPVNLDAIQEYDELEQRQIFLERQIGDLVKSKAELHTVIARINRTTKELFADTFARICENFQIMFAELFGGGRASLMLIDEGDPLESGIEIIAKPPGKQLQSISLLSGGERTMTAVALLFAIYMVKPSPFCVLDEMDAPLDESNINRFIKILDRFVDQSQFVVITHNKRTISRADVLYGVTMEEQGVSKIVSVNFAGKERPPAQSPTAPERFEKIDEERTNREPATV